VAELPQDGQLARNEPCLISLLRVLSETGGVRGLRRNWLTNVYLEKRPLNGRTSSYQKCFDFVSIACNVKFIFFCTF